ncbi:hypothetical protein F4808DRAFT_355031 [Astrocystis sublimbata]|nr:hypothetical protein F4808DRAFT_355031 [Astrocystis sublimbata]
MVGVPKSKRCTFCKTRKTKCDENWPTCGTCARAGKICSGARSTFKFVVNGSHNEIPDDGGHIIDNLASNPNRLPFANTLTSTSMSANSNTNSPRTDRDRRRRIGEIIVLHPKNMATMTNLDNLNLSLSRAIPKPLPWNPPDQLIAHLIASLDIARGTGHDLRILGPFLPLIPQHLTSGCGSGSHNVALAHAVELLLGAWTNSRRGLPSHTWLDLRTYNRALRSLQAALDDSNEEHLNNTLAALCVLQKTEVLYDFARGSNQENHAAGLIAVINRGGPAQPKTGMTLHVMFESLFHMLQEDIRQSRDSGFHTPEWMAALHEAIDESDLSPVLKESYRLWVEVTAWPGLVRLVRALRRNPDDTATATELRLRASSLAEKLRYQNETILASLLESGAITQTPNLVRPDLFAKCYSFANFPTAKLFCSHAMFNIITYRCLQEANRVLERKDANAAMFAEKQAKKYSRRIWMAYPWLRHQTPLAVDFTASLLFSYESGNEEERAFCSACLREMDSSRHPPPIGEWVEATITANAKAYSGRLPFVKTQNPKVEYDGIGCRS